MMICRLIIVLTLLAALSSCAQPQGNKPEYPLQVGDIYFDAGRDDSNFKLCDETQVQQYYSFGKGVQYKGEKIKINEHFTVGLKESHENDESGFLTIRFIVNCQGKTGRFRVLGMDSHYKEKTFSSELTEQLLTLTRQLDGWIVGEHEGKVYDYYQYLTFKIENGQLIEIMP